VQTFLPYPDFAQSAAALDSPRLGKQRVEVLQILRAITFPSYGWTNHPATRMWRGYVPALASYGLAMVDEWVSRGAADSTRAQIAEFAPIVEDVPIDQLSKPVWLGNPELHRSHQSNLIRKLPEFYRPQFPGVPDDLDYVWPEPDVMPPAEPLDGSPIWIFRAHDDAQLEGWIEHGEVTIGELSPSGRIGPKWQRQVESFLVLPIGTRLAALGSDTTLRLGTLASDANAHVEDGLNPTEIFFRDVKFHGSLQRSDFPYPALLQDPRTLFETVGPLP
jgi:hypothetical protein